MDRRSRRKNVSNLAVVIIFLIPIIAYAVTEILICFFWNLILRALHELCCFFHEALYKNFENGKTTRRELVEAQNSPQYETLVTSQLHQQMNSSSQHVKEESDRDFYRSTESPVSAGYFNKTSEKKEKLQAEETSLNKQSVEKDANNNDGSSKQRPQLVRKQWITRNITWKVTRDTVNTKLDDVILHTNSAAGCQINSQGKQMEEDVHNGKGKIPNSKLANQKCSYEGKENEQDSGEQGIFDSILMNENKTSRNCEVLSVKRKETTGGYRLHEASSDRTKENVKRLKQANNPIPSTSDEPKEKSHSTAGVTSYTDIQTPVITSQAVNRSPVVGLFKAGKEKYDSRVQQHQDKTTATATTTTTTKSVQIEEHKHVTNSFQTATSVFKGEERSQLDAKGFHCNLANDSSLGKEIQTSKFSSVGHLDIAPTRAATGSALQERVTQAEFSTAPLTTSPQVRHLNEQEATGFPSNADRHHPNSNLLDTNAKRKTTEKRNAPYLLRIKNNDQKRETATTNSRGPKLKTEQAKRSRLHFARAPQRPAVRYNKIPLL